VGVSVAVLVGIHFLLSTTRVAQQPRTVAGVAPGE
jgi:hypothetical protein